MPIVRMAKYCFLVKIFVCQTIERLPVIKSETEYYVIIFYQNSYIGIKLSI